MLADIEATFDALRDDRSVRAIVLRGAGGHFCAGADLKSMLAGGVKPAGAADDPIAAVNRRFGAMLRKVAQAPQVVIAICEGAVLGGGFGLACVSDIAIAADGAQFGLPETSLGILPAQIAPFVVKRIGLTQARRLALTAARFDGREALRLGLVHFSETRADELGQRLAECLEQVRRCAPGANAQTKALLLASETEALGPLLDEAAKQFAAAVTGAEGAEGTLAFVQKRKPQWAQ